MKGIDMEIDYGNLDKLTDEELIKAYNNEYELGVKGETTQMALKIL